MLIIGNELKMLRESHNLTGRCAGKAAGHHAVEQKCVELGLECTEYTVYLSDYQDFQGSTDYLLCVLQKRRR